MTVPHGAVEQGPVATRVAEKVASRLEQPTAEDRIYCCGYRNCATRNTELTLFRAWVQNSCRGVLPDDGGMIPRGRVR